MEQEAVSKLRHEIMTHESNHDHTKNGYIPLFQASSESKIVIIGQAPGIRAQTSGVPWNDASGVRLRSWLGVSKEQFRNPDIIALIPMDFYYPGKGASGDAPPRKDFAPLWHAKLMDLMPNIRLIILVGQYAQRYYLKTKHATLTDTVRNNQMYLPDYFPIVHPSPLNFRWHTKNPWFENEVVPELQKLVVTIIRGVCAN